LFIISVAPLRIVLVFPSVLFYNKEFNVSVFSILTPVEAAYILPFLA
jgi:hypothetical protein